MTALNELSKKDQSTYLKWALADGFLDKDPYPTHLIMPSGAKRVSVFGTTADDYSIIAYMDDGFTLTLSGPHPTDEATITSLWNNIHSEVG